MDIGEVYRLPGVNSMEVAARALGMSQATAYRLAAEGKFPVPVEKYGSVSKVRRASLLQYLDPTGIDRPSIAASGSPS